LDNADLIDVASYATSEKGWISEGGKMSKRILSQPHQILCAPDRRVICTNTGRNVITVLDLAHSNVFQEAGVTENRWDRLTVDNRIGDHLNSVFLRGNTLYVIAHSHYNGSKIATFSYPELSLMSVENLPGRTGLHNIWITPEGQRISCHSEIGGIIDLAAKQPLWEAGTAIYTRGLAANSEYVLVGESQRGERAHRASSLSALWIIDRRSWRALDYIALGPYGAVHEVRIVDGVDEAHHGAPFEGLARILETNLDSRMKKVRLSAASAAYAAKQLWADYDLVFGAPQTLEDGSKDASPESLCLAVLGTQSSEVKLDFTYSFKANQFGHVSAVIGYSGAGGDSNMSAFLLRPDGEMAFLSVWKNDGVQWIDAPDIAIMNCPLEGRVECEASKDKVKLLIDKREIISMSADQLGVRRCDSGLGIRWLGARVKPAARGQ